mmetsp:Transcript_7378/g.20390  ORF Transcript_7378/g.20390 Transcript_7378/m.20390 type:complete len:201 (-) Transcript_7378:79-681(-)
MSTGVEEDDGAPSMMRTESAMARRKGHDARRHTIVGLSPSSATTPSTPGGSDFEGFVRRRAREIDDSAMRGRRCSSLERGRQDGSSGVAIFRVSTPNPQCGASSSAGREDSMDCESQDDFMTGGTEEEEADVGIEFFRISTPQQSPGKDDGSDVGQDRSVPRASVKIFRMAARGECLDAAPGDAAQGTVPDERTPIETAS